VTLADFDDPVKALWFAKIKPTNLKDLKKKHRYQI
jgi:hypothetical protein